MGEVSDRFVDSEVDRLRRVVSWLFVGGIAVAVIGTALAISQWPSTEITSAGISDSLSTEETGNAQAAWALLICAGLGQIAATISIVAWGVRLGMDTSESRRLRR
jgi:hypothetical protein